ALASEGDEEPNQGKGGDGKQG
ncbi:MAG: hypothetical protein RL759_1296, partial [Verrucomicrobiota bacterium]